MGGGVEGGPNIPSYSLFKSNIETEDFAIRSVITLQKPKKGKKIFDQKLETTRVRLRNY